MEEKLRPIIINEEITNISDVFDAIDQSTDIHFLQVYLIEVDEVIKTRNVKHLPELSDKLLSRIKEISQSNILKEEDLVIISAVKANQLIIKLYDQVVLTSEEINQLNNFVNLGLNQMEDETINYDHQNSIDMYIEHLKTKEMNLTTEESQIIFKYANIIEAKEKSLNKKIEKQAVKKLTVLNTNGAVITVVILEVTILLGMLISVLALVKR